MPRNLTLRLSSVGHSLVTRNRKVDYRPRVWGRAVVIVLVLLTAGVIFTSLIWAWGNLQYVTLSYQTSQAEETQKQYLELNKKLRIEFSHLTAISRLEKLAVEHYGMAPPQPSQIVSLP